MAVSSFAEVQVVLDAIETQLAELLALINAKPSRKEMNDAIDAVQVTVDQLRSDFNDLDERVSSNSRSITSLGETLANYIETHP